MSVSATGNVKASSVHVVWFKHDLRARDHECLQRACAHRFGAGSEFNYPEADKASKVGRWAKATSEVAARYEER